MVSSPAEPSLLSHVASLLTSFNCPVRELSSATGGKGSGVYFSTEVERFVMSLRSATAVLIDTHCQSVTLRGPNIFRLKSFLSSNKITSTPNGKKSPTWT